MAFIRPHCRAFVSLGTLLLLATAGCDVEMGNWGQARDERIIERDSGEELAWTIFQPSVIFGPDDGFVNTFAGLLKFSPMLPLAMPDSRFGPVSVDDVAEAFVLSLDDPQTESRRFELCGPKTYTLRELVELICATMEIRRLIIDRETRLRLGEIASVELKRPRQDWVT